MSSNLFSHNFFQHLKDRGLLFQSTAHDDNKSFSSETDPTIQAINKGSLTLYCGFDPTADGLHIGHLMGVLMLKRFQMAGHRPIALIGGATGMVGDPSGKSQERNLLTSDIIEKNIRGIEKEMKQLLDFSDNKALLVNNADWTKDVHLLDFLRDIGKHFTVNYMMAKESIRARLEDRENGISFTEFSYMLLQSYDFYILNKQYNCQLQIGGSDQWGNITAGTELIRRMAAIESPQNKKLQHKESYGLTFPLVTKSDGTKFGKTEKGSVWLNPDKTSPYDFYQFFVRTEDADVIRYLNYFTFLPQEEIEELKSEMKKNPEKRTPQKKLAQELTKLVHGEEEVKKVENASQALFGTGIKDLDEKTLLETFKEAPSTTIPQTELQNLDLLDLLQRTGVCPSKGAARREVQGGGIYLNNNRTQDPQTKLTSDLLISGKYIVIRKGKKNYHLVIFK